MQKKFYIVIGIIIFVIFLGVIYLVFANKSSLNLAVATSTPQTATPSPIANTDCTNDQLSASASYEPAAGNIYGTLTITNTSNTDCTVTLGDTIKANYTASNISINYESNPPTLSQNLHPGDKVYSQVHYPNGPQCQSEILPKPVIFSYEMNNIKVDFDSTSVSACAGSENTQIDIWPLSIKPINS
jgi:hypothetical protein